MTRRLAASGRTRRHCEAGVGTVSAVFGVLAFLGFVLLAVQVALYAFTASVVQTAALDGATPGAGAAAGTPLLAARDRASAVLGGMADDAVITGAVRTDVSGRVLVVTVSVPPPSTVVRGLGSTRIERTAEARIEE